MKFVKKHFVKKLRLSEYKFLELEIFWDDDWTWFSVYTKLDRKCDHQGFKFNFQVYKLDFNFQIYDSRHWDYDNDEYQK